MGALSEAVLELAEDLISSGTTDGKSIDRAAIKYLRRRGPFDPSTEMVIELADAVRAHIGVEESKAEAQS